MTRVDWSGHWVDPTDLSFGLLTLYSICIELMIRSGTIGKFSAGQPNSKLPNSYSALTQGMSDLRRDTQSTTKFKRLFLSKEAPDQKSEKNTPGE